MGDKRPPFWRFRQRALWDAMHMPWYEYKARVLTPEEAEEFDIHVPESWFNKSAKWVLENLGLRDGKLPEGSGAGLVHSPYVDFYTKTYGVDPIRDLPKYRKMIRTQPDIQQALELQTSMAIGKGFYIEHSDKKIKAYLNKVADEINLLENMLVMGFDMLGYGNSYTEILWSDTVTKKEQVFKKDSTLITKEEAKTFNINPKNLTAVKNPDNGGTYVATYVKREEKNSKGKVKEKVKILGLKPLDPVYMRVRRDAWGNVYGYAQWIVAPPIFLSTKNVIHIKYRPKSSGYEGAYGMSILMALIKNNDLLEQFENDAAVWIHSRAVPPLIAKGGTPEKPYSSTQMKDLLSKLKNRTAASIIAVKGDVELKELEGVARNLNLNWYLQYILNRRYQALGVPPIIMGVPEGTNRSTSEVVFQDFITRLQIIQNQIGDAIETQVLWPLIKTNFGPDVEKPKIIWKPIVEEDRNMRAQRLIQALQAGAVSINEFRQAIGYPKIDGRPDLDFVRGVPSGGMFMPSGDPRKVKPQKPDEFAKPPPEGVKKKEGNLEEEIRLRKIKLMIAQESLKDELLGLIETTKFELRQGDRTVSDIKTEVLSRAEEIINKYIVDVYLFGKMDAFYTKKGEQDTELTIYDLQVKEEDLPEIVRLKKEYIRNFEKIVSDMILAKSEGKL